MNTEIIVLPAAAISADLASMRQELSEMRRLLEAMRDAPTKSPWMTAREVCEYRRFSDTTLRAKVKAGEITRYDTPRWFDPSRDHIAPKYRVDLQRGIFFLRTFVPLGVSLGPVFA